MANFQMSFSYSQISDFDGRLESPFNEWTPQYVSQGFSWRPGAVSFKTLIVGGIAQVEVVVRKSLRIKRTTQRAISVPFIVDSDMQLEIASIEQSIEIDVPTGEYQLCFETGLDAQGGSWVVFTFIVNGDMDYKILVQDEDLHPSSPLLRTANPG